MRGEYEKRMKEIIAYLQAHADEVILFIDEIHTLIGAGKAAGSMDASQILKVPLARGEIVYVHPVYIYIYMYNEILTRCPVAACKLNASSSAHLHRQKGTGQSIKPRQSG